MSKNFYYCLSILKKVSFDPALFRKELSKAYDFLNPEERSVLSMWVVKYTQKHKKLKSLGDLNYQSLTLG